MCIKDSQGISKSHDPITVDYAIVGGNLLFPLHAKKKKIVKIRSSFKVEKEAQNKKDRFFGHIQMSSRSKKIYCVL